MTNLYQLPADLPIPQDDGAANHLVGMRLPIFSLCATSVRNLMWAILKAAWLSIASLHAPKIVLLDEDNIIKEIKIVN